MIEHRRGICQWTSTGPLQPFFDKTWRPGEIEDEIGKRENDTSEAIVSVRISSPKQTVEGLGVE